MKSRRNKAEDAPGPMLPITPMLDMAFQLFAFFVVTYHPSGMEGQMELNLPAMGEKKAQTQEQADPKAQSEMELELPAEITVVANTQPGGPSQGMISQLQVQQREGNIQVESLDALLPRLKTIRNSLTNKQDIKIQADSRLKWASVVELMDICRKAGFEGIGFGPPPDLGG